jgi:hypothetical protein
MRKGESRELNVETLSAQRGRYRSGMVGMSSINHDPCYHRLPYLSNGIIVLVFSELASFVRKILQLEENKGGRVHCASWEPFAGGFE